ncbi:MAG: DUF4928 family protein [Planctomycetota bacterium]
MTLGGQLRAFADAHRMRDKGALCVALVVTRHAKARGLPLKPEELRTKGKGQVLGLGKAAVQGILKDHGITRVLAEEGGRTSRGSLGNMETYVAFLNKLTGKGTSLDLDQVEMWWVDRVKEFFASKPFVLRFDSSKSLRAIIRDLLAQALARQREAPGTMYVGALLQHLVGAKLDIVLGGIEHHGSSVADGVSGRSADFLVGDTAIHVTTSPGEALLRKCVRNLDSSLRPLVVTLSDQVAVAEGLAKQAFIADRLDVLDAEQFLAGNLFEHGRFELAGRMTTAGALIEKYNAVVAAHETDPSLRVRLAT